MNATTTIKYCVICKTNATECSELFIPSRMYTIWGYEIPGTLPSYGKHGSAIIDIQISLDEYQNNIKNNVWPKLKNKLTAELLTNEDKKEIDSISRSYADNVTESKKLTIENCPIPLKDSKFTFFLLFFSLSLFFFLLSLKIFSLNSMLIIFAPILITLLITFYNQYNYNNTILSHITGNGPKYDPVWPPIFWTGHSEEELKIQYTLNQLKENHNKLWNEEYSKKYQELIKEKTKSIQL